MFEIDTPWSIRNNGGNKTRPVNITLTILIRTIES